ncbi:Asp23/Gls24 family envelope stress response protein [Corynebacterium sp. YSMAA5_1_F9]|uniref:Asp23/Gls24 family envelope stress response protein n=1 Tax=unclassified Corynebacterium TaxID=2624378 RepID=UPI0038D0252F
MTPPLNELAPASSGKTQLSLRAMERVIAAAIASVPGTAAVDAKLAGLAGRAFPRIMAQMDPDARVVAVDTTIAVYWPSPVTDVAAAVRTAVSDAVRDFTGFRTTRVNVTVGGAVAGERTSALEVSTRAPLRAQVPAIVPEHALRPVTTAPGVGVRHVATPAAAAVRGVRTPAEAPVQSVAVLGDVSVRTSDFGPSTHRYDELRPVTTAPAEPLRAVRDPEPVAVRSVPLPGEFSLRRVEAPRPVRPRRVETPRPLRTRPVSVPRATALRPVEIRPSAEFTRRVDVPRPAPLRAITITPFHEGGRHE